MTVDNTSVENMIEELRSATPEQEAIFTLLRDLKVLHVAAIKKSAVLSKECHACKPEYYKGNISKQTHDDAIAAAVQAGRDEHTLWRAMASIAEHVIGNKALGWKALGIIA